MPGISFSGDPVFANSLGDIANAFATGPMRQLQAQQTMQDIIMKGIERKRLEDQISTGNAAGAATQAVFQGQVNPQPGAPGGADAAAPAAPANIWGDTTPAPQGGIVPNAPPPQPKQDPMTAARIEMYRTQIEAARAKGDLAELRRLAALGPMAVTGQVPQDFNTRELAHAQGVDIPTVPTTPGSTPEAASATLDNTERFLASNPNAQLSPQQALGALQAANKSAETTYDKDTASLITVPKAQLSPRLQAELARHGLVMAGTGTGVPPPGGTIPGQPAPAGAPQQFGAAPLVRMTPDAARLQFENKTSKSTSYQDAKIAVDAANDIHDLYTNPLAEGELPFLRDQAALTKYREAVQSHIARLAAVGGSRDDIAGSQSILANINDALAAAQQGKQLSEGQRKGLFNTAKLLAEGSNRSYEQEHSAARNTYAQQLGPEAGNVAVPSLAVRQPDWKTFGTFPTSPPPPAGGGSNTDPNAIRRRLMGVQ
jgi:hypothetical protein